MKALRLALCQINPVVGDIEYNTAKIIEFINKAKEEEADIVIFPELAITGYPPEDLIFKTSFIEKNIKAVKEIAKHSKDLITIVGFIDKEIDIYNAAAVLFNGNIEGIYHKQFLPNYGVFDEVRYFQKGKKNSIIQLQELKIGLSICEDIWYPENPINIYAIEGASLVININASPYFIGKIKKREEMIKTRARDNIISIAYLNIVGAQDELVFDGNSFVVDGEGEIIAKGKSFEEDLIIADIDFEQTFRNQLKDNRIRNLRTDYKREENLEIINIDYQIKEKSSITPEKIYLDTPEIEQTYKALVVGLRDYIQKNNFKKVVIGLSGGIDSSLTATIAVDALGNENVKGVLMPSMYTSKESIEDALEVAKNLSIETFTIPIIDIYNSYISQLSDIFKNLPQNTTEENLQARIRGNILMALSNKFGWIVLATGNKSEMSVGYSTLYGDMVGGFAVLKDVLKTKVYELSYYRNSIKKVIPDRVLKKPPSAELRPNQTDEAELLPYEILDEIIKMYVEEDIPANIILERFPENKERVKRIIRLIDTNEYKRRQSPIGIKITERAFGKDRRMPIVNRFSEI
ncbi:NAD+ synthase [Venenivibrio stagnispumantis]|uniref:Glutamine-dependent NAD(+) synthetase n=1 Tax=Venenivibrio stagnispumantis TaxID=407998 RepID=A0AA45WMM2_9AQUI|nr:NAD+ synthase [Venenivibrio stagnispumantis]MCW4573773.1 NAD+ synthase [Venenivibrio stagnispumantis]SMP14869.1 NAD+ synthase (glutamine-hydrolysing) [Venenivibrio stagnispumantis]